MKRSVFAFLCIFFVIQQVQGLYIFEHGGDQSEDYALTLPDLNDWDARSDVTNDRMYRLFQKGGEKSGRYLYRARPLTNADGTVSVAGIKVEVMDFENYPGTYLECHQFSYIGQSFLHKDRFVYTMINKRTGKLFAFVLERTRLRSKSFRR